MLEAMKEKAKKLKGEVYALYLACRHPDTPWYAKVWIGLVVAYALSPIDLIPDFIPVLGYLDDLILVPLGIALALKLVPPPVMAECRERALRELQGKKLVSLPAAFVIGLIWLALLILFIRWAVGLVNHGGNRV